MSAQAVKHIFEELAGQTIYDVSLSPCGRGIILLTKEGESLTAIVDDSCMRVESADLDAAVREYLFPISEWISVDERLPSYINAVRVVTHNRCRTFGSYCCLYGWRVFDGESMVAIGDDAVEYWIDLPEPPEATS